MRKYILILVALVGLLAIQTPATAQTPLQDSLKNYTDQYIRNSAITAFTNNRLNWLLKAIIENLGGSGGSGITVQLRNNGTYIQYKYSNQSDFFWQNLVALADLTGAQGPAGPQGTPGPSVEIGHNTTHLQYRPVGTLTWTNIIPLDSLKGPQGPPGSGGGGGSSVWGAITGSILDQLDLQTALAARQPVSKIFFTTTATNLGSVTVPNIFPLLQTSGYSVDGKGGALYVRTNTTGATRWRFQTADGQWWQLADQRMTPRMFGAIGDSTDATAAIQAALDYTKSNDPNVRYGTGTAIDFSEGGIYLYSKLTIHSGNTLTDSRVQHKGGFNLTNGNGAALIHIQGSIPADSFSIVTDVNAQGWGINGLQIFGGSAGASTLTAGGIKVHSVLPGYAHDWRITNNTIKGWGLEALWITGGSPYTVSDNMIQGCNNISYLVAKGVPTGAIKAAGVDAFFFHNEFTGSANQYGANMIPTSTDQLIGAAYFQGLALSKLSYNIYQVSESGLRHPGSDNRYTNERFDTNAGSGIYLVSGGSDNVFRDIQIVRNSLGADSTYDGIYSNTSGGRNKFRGIYFGSGATFGSPLKSYKMRYFINDLKGDYASNNGFSNDYEDIQITGLPANAEKPFNFNSDQAAGGRLFVPQGGAFRRLAGETPTVLLGSHYAAFNASTTTITNFRGGVTGQVIGLVNNNLAGGQTWVKNTDSIKLRKAGDSIQLTDQKIEYFVYTGRYWLQTTGAEVGEGTYQPLNQYLTQISGLSPVNGAAFLYNNGWKVVNDAQFRLALSIAGTQQLADTAAALRAAIGSGGGGSDPAKLNISDTSSMLTAYRNGLNARVKYTDTTAMLAAYRTAIGARATQSGLNDTAAALRSLYNDSASFLPISVYPLSTDTVPTQGGVVRKIRDSLVTLYAPLASPALTGVPTAPTITTSDSSNTIATTAFVKRQGYGTGGGGGSTTPGGTNDGDVQYKSGSTFAGAAAMNWDNTNSRLKIGTDATAAPYTLTLPNSGNGLGIYNSAINGTNYERGVVGFQTNVFVVGTESGGTGTGRIVRLQGGSGGSLTTLDLQRGAFPLMRLDATISTAGDFFSTRGSTTLSSGTANISVFAPTMNQSGTATGRAFLISPFFSTTGSGSQEVVNIGTNSAASNGGTHTSYFRMLNNGRIGIAGVTPTARFHIAAGSATANTAPLKFTSGTSLTTPEDGAVEYDGTNYFVTQSTTRYTLAKTLTATATLDFPSTATGASSDLTITVTGAADGDVVDIGVPNAAAAGGSYFAWVSAANTVTVRFTATTTTDPASATFRAAITKY